jgi:hypothetical protein
MAPRLVATRDEFGSDPVEEFNQWSRQAAFTSDEGRRFLPFSEVQKYLSNERIEELLTFISVTSRHKMMFTRDGSIIEKIQTKYPRVFCILLRLEKGELIERFCRIEQLQDDCLPFTDPENLQRLTDYNDRRFWKDFCDQQWFFLPGITAVSRGDDVHFQESTILPITRRETLFSGRVNIDKIYAHDSFSHLESYNPVGRFSNCNRPRSISSSLRKPRYRFTDLLQGSSSQFQNIFLLKIYRAQDVDTYRLEMENIRRLERPEEIPSLTPTVRMGYIGSFEHRGAYNVLLEYTDVPTMLKMAVVRHGELLVRAFSNVESDALNYKDDAGWTPLAYAAVYRYDYAVLPLL